MTETIKNSNPNAKFIPKHKSTKGKAPVLVSKGVTEREAKFSEKLVELLGKGMKRAQAIKEASDYAYTPTPATRGVAVYQVLGRDRVQKYISECLTKAGMGHEAVLQDLRRAITLGLASGDAKVSDAIKGLDIALRLHNMYPAQKIESRSVKFNADMMGKSHRDLNNQLKSLEDEENELVEEGEVIEVVGETPEPDEAEE
jgi:hypothetical protein